MDTKRYEDELNVPVVLCVFKRLETTKQVFKKIREARPHKLYVISDAPRKEQPQEAEQVIKVRQYVEENIDWDCEFVKNYAESNMGCGKRLSSGLTWVFEREEQAIILEDDCVPDNTFFKYCEEMLTKYKNDERILLVSGNNPIAHLYPTQDDYLFSKVPFIWGWATWRRAWKLYDYNIKSWSQNRNNPIFKKYIPVKKAYWLYTSEFEVLYSGKFDDTWSYQLMYTGLLNSMFGILPSKSHVFNIGFMEESTHTKHAPKWINQEVEPVTFPIKHREEVIWDKDFDVCYMKHAGEHGLTIKIKALLGLDINKSVFEVFRKKR